MCYFIDVSQNQQTHQVPIYVQEECLAHNFISAGKFEVLISVLYAGVSYNFEKTDNVIFRLKLTANAKKIIADLRRPLEILMKGNTINHPDLTISAVSYFCPMMVY